jgi:hydroxypyruvate isomerase
MNDRPWRMRYTAHLGLRAPDLPLFSHSARSKAPDDQIAYIASIGFAGVQDNFLKLRPDDEQRRIGAALAEHGLAMGSFTNNPHGWNQPLWNSREHAARAELRRDLESSIAAAARVDGHIATCVTGFDPARPRAGQIEAMIENLSALADDAASGGLLLCVEPVAASWIPGMLVDNIADALAIVRAVDHPAVRLQFDFAHIESSDGDVLRHLQDCWSWIGAIQVADTPGRTDLGAGVIDWPAALRILHANGWQGLLEIEHMPQQESAEGEARLLDRLRTIERNIQ